MLHGQGVGKLLVARLRKGLERALRGGPPGQSVQLTGHRANLELRLRRSARPAAPVGDCVLRDPHVRRVLQRVPNSGPEQSPHHLDGHLCLEGGENQPAVRVRAGAVLADRQCQAAGATVPVPRRNGRGLFEGRQLRQNCDRRSGAVHDQGKGGWNVFILFVVLK